jgi:hypothetical protein
MPALFRDPLLAVFTVLALAFGAFHQIESRYSEHSHCEPCLPDNHGGEEDEPAKNSSDHRSSSEHLWCCHHAAAVLDLFKLSVAPRGVVVGIPADAGRHGPERDPAEIEHPPQLA